MDGFDLIEPFDIDGGELSGLSPELCFTLGVEWGKVTSALDAGELGPFPIHAENVARLCAAVLRRGLIVSSARIRNGWAELIVDRMVNDG
jgi:hypothetical protein